MKWRYKQRVQEADGLPDLVYWRRGARLAEAIAGAGNPRPAEDWAYPVELASFSLLVRPDVGNLLSVTVYCRTCRLQF
eukprot:SAG11_NODE_6579_length_1285_cov_1.161889_2_plen_78_part_00